LEELLKELERRTANAIALMRKSGVEYIALTPSPNFRYLTGFFEEGYERLILFILTVNNDRVLLAPKLANIPSWFNRYSDIVLWGDEDNVGSIVDKVARRLRIYGKKGAFEDTMSLRTYELLKEELSPSGTVLVSTILRELRIRKSLYEINIISRAVKIAENIFSELYRILSPGLSERFVASQISSLIASEGYAEAFNAIVAFGENTANPHHIPGSKVLSYGDLVLVDLGIVVDGYVSDLTRIYSLGPVPKNVEDSFTALISCFNEAISIISPGVRAAEVDLRVRSCLTDYGLGGNILHRTGHGIGLEIHEPPYLSITSTDVLDRGNVFTVEPGVYFRGNYGLRIESDIAILDNGDTIILDKSSKDIIRL